MKTFWRVGAASVFLNLDQFYSGLIVRALLVADDERGTFCVTKRVPVDPMEQNNARSVLGKFDRDLTVTVL
jgi:hypothetical protein